MPILKQAKKAIRSDEKKRSANDRRRRALKNTLKDFTKGKVTDISLVYKAIDKAEKGGIIKKNTAARRKSRFAKLASMK